MTHFLQSRAMLVNLSVSAWTASKKDSKASVDIKAAKGAGDKAGWFNKRLIDPTALQPMSKIEGAARDFHYKMTLPWGDNGDRMLPAAAYMDYTDAIRKLRQQYDDAVDVFIQDYPSLVQSARVMLGSMYDAGDYPEAHRIKQRFGMSLVFTPVPDAADFRVDVGDEAVAEIRKSITDSVEKRLEGATKECWLRLEDVVEKIAATLADPDRVFRDSLIENARTVCDILPKLNIRGDIQLDKYIGLVRTHLLMEPDSLRKNKRQREVTAAAATDIMMDIRKWTMTTSPTNP